MKCPPRTSPAIMLAALGALLMATAQAKADVNTIRSSNNVIWGAAGANQFAYKETVPAPDLPDSERDWIPSLAAGASVMGPSGLYLALEGAYSFGNAHYNGAYFASPTTPLQGTTQEKIWDADGKIGKGLALGSGAMLTPYVELGVRYWGRHLGPGQTEDYRNFDALGGTMLQVSPTNRLVLSAYGSGGTTFSPRMRTGGTTYHLGAAGIYKIGGKIGYDVTQRLELFTTLDYEHFSYGQSAVINSTYEPNSTTNDTSVRIGLAYHFK